MGAGFLRITFLGLVASIAALAGPAAAQQRPAIGGVRSLPDAMIFYVAHGRADACGPGCSDWIAAEGTIEWDTYKRLLAILDRQNGRKLPVLIQSWGVADIKVAMGLGRILRDRGIDVMVAATEAEACTGQSRTDCFALKRPGGPLDARIRASGARCDLACIFVLAGGVHRSLPADTTVTLNGVVVESYLNLNVPAEHREGLTAQFAQQSRLYLRQMGIEPELADMADRAGGLQRSIELPPSEWTRLGLVTTPR